MWEISIDVGGTFTDCLARSPDGQILLRKVLSSGITKGYVESIADPHQWTDSARIGDTPDLWVGYGVRFLDDANRVVLSSTITAFNTLTGTLTANDSLLGLAAAPSKYELFSDEEAPLVAIRSVLGLRRDQSIPPVTVRLGTTRGTNALLTRRGARVAFVTTKGFGDLLLIGNQDRPRLFDLAINKPSPLFESVMEVDERIDAQGRLLKSLDPEQIREQFHSLRSRGIESVAICLLHAFAFPAHEQIITQLAREMGFTEVSVSHEVAPAMKIVSRGETTIVDAYLNPILRRYVQSLNVTLNDGKHDVSHNGRLRLMTSAGGLVPPSQFTGKDSILSGPAGGVIGFSKVALQAGFAKAIGFDMGGTSTDVARFDGRYDIEYEGRKAGVRIVTPMLAVETVAAGGGSLCGFDGVKLTVGPDSAGSDPGPVCYGRGGPLTVTDINLFLGRILANRFPFPLDILAVNQKLQCLCDEIAGTSANRQYTPHELAEGFLQIANANMTKPIRSISVARGYDPRDFVLVAFGSAGGQHACAIASELGIQKILSHPFAGLLSAYGISLADVRRHSAQPVMKPYSNDCQSELASIFSRLEAECRRAIEEECIAGSNALTFIRSLDLRYLGMDAAMNIVSIDNGDYATRYHELHQRLYGYAHSHRTIEIVAARVEAVTARTGSPITSSVLPPLRPRVHSQTTTWFKGLANQTDIYLRADLRPGDTMDGPAIVCEPTSTLVIDPGFHAAVMSQGEILISRTKNLEPVKDSIPTDSQIADPILLELFNNQFASIAEQMGIALQRTAFSTNVKERLDYSCAIFSATGKLVVNAPHIPVHLGAMSETVERIVLDNPVIRPGDVFVTNDPYRGGSHLPDVTVITPVHDETTNERLFFTACRAHHAEIGGISPGSMPPFSTNLADEGVLIRNFKLVHQGHFREAELRELLLNGPFPTRAIHDNLADLSAQVAANQSGANALRELIQKHSRPVVLSYMQHIQVAAEQKTRIALGRLPDGEYQWTDHLDDGSPLSVTIAIRGTDAVVDFAGTGPVLAGNLNANRAIVTAAVMYVFRCLIDEEIPLNSGVLEPISIRIPECFLNPPDGHDAKNCAAIVGGNVETSQRVVDVLLGALGVAAASQGTMNNLTFGDGSFGYYETICGGSGATRQSDGADAVHTHMTNTRLTDPEVLEWRFPVRLREFSIRKGSGGAGRHRGGDGVRRHLEFLKRLRVSVISERRGPFPPYGLEGGEPGQCGMNALRQAGSDQWQNVGGKFQCDVEAGDQLILETPGGGGFGAEIE